MAPSTNIGKNTRALLTTAVVSTGNNRFSASSIAFLDRPLVVRLAMNDDNFANKIGTDAEDNDPVDPVSAVSATVLVPWGGPSATSKEGHTVTTAKAACNVRRGAANDN